MNWLSLNSEQQLQEALTSEPVFAVFKHSTRCSISSMAKSRVERDWNFEFPIYYLDLIQHRNISNFIADESGIEHQSPQLIVFQNGKPVYNASHSGINIDELKSELTNS